MCTVFCGFCRGAPGGSGAGGHHHHHGFAGRFAPGVGLAPRLMTTSGMGAAGITYATATINTAAGGIAGADDSAEHAEEAGAYSTYVRVRVPREEYMFSVDIYRERLR